MTAPKGEALGIITFKAKLTLSIIKLAVVQLAKTTAIIAKIPLALLVHGPKATGKVSPLNTIVRAPEDFRYTAYKNATAIHAI